MTTQATHAYPMTGRSIQISCVGVGPSIGSLGAASREGEKDPVRGRQVRRVGDRHRRARLRDPQRGRPVAKRNGKAASRDRIDRRGARGSAIGGDRRRSIGRHRRGEFGANRGGGLPSSVFVGAKTSTDRESAHAAERAVGLCRSGRRGVRARTGSSGDAAPSSLAVVRPIGQPGSGDRGAAVGARREVRPGKGDGGGTPRLRGIASRGGEDPGDRQRISRDVIDDGGRGDRCRRRRGVAPGAALARRRRGSWGDRRRHPDAPADPPSGDREGNRVGEAVPRW